MEKDMMNKFTSDHASQYKVVSDDMRFYSEQRFRIVSVYLIVSGLLINVVKDYKSVELAIVGLVFSYLCFSWEARSTRWWGTLIEQAKKLEDLAIANGHMIEVYKRYWEQKPPTALQKLALLRPTLAVTAVYFFGFIGWGLYAVASWCKW